MGFEWAILVARDEYGPQRTLVLTTSVYMGVLDKPLCILWIKVHDPSSTLMDRRPRDRPASRMITRMCSPCRIFYRNNPEAIWVPNPSNPIADDDMCHGCVTNAQVASYLQSQGFD